MLDICSIYSPYTKYFETLLEHGVQMSYLIALKTYYAVKFWEPFVYEDRLELFDINLLHQCADVQKHF